ncbi:MAM and LDL-receptor class A domain-containing protein 1-like [Tigriopus californicus]|uniref:MAM and LDL-receptor class A domain-containing protein 1-like n=1 Tax=Tigriopus californicus TaxID=6832 RepID=UPI0027DA2C04|nr:MAM and LDL-receptor class A domain-containing protein 1-like [Tigriopus californicus]
MSQSWNRYEEQAQLAVKKNPFYFQLVAEIANQPNHTDIRGDIAIDDILLSVKCQRYQGEFSTTEASSTPGVECLTNEFECSPGECISLEKVCDFNQDCQSGMDEKDCGSCNFEYDQCAYGDASAVFYWERRSPSEDQGQGPPVDHTLGEEGHFMTTLQTEGELNSQATLASPKLAKLLSLCQVRFWYFVPDVEDCHPSLELSIGSNDDDTHQLMHIKEMSQGQWTQEAASLGHHDPGQKLAFKAFNGCANQSQVCPCSVSLDDLKLQSCNQDVSVFDCTFDQGDSCQWTEEQSETGGWTITNETYSDHTTSNGMMATLNLNTEVGAEAILKSPSLPPNARFCLSFWLHMYGQAPGLLRVELESDIPNDEEAVVLWERSGSQDQTWIGIQILIQSPWPSRIVFLGVGSEPGSTDVSVDDFKLSNGACPKQETCTFEIGYCDWHHANSSFSWTRDSASHALDPVPPNDHSLQTDQGHFLYLDSSESEVGASAILRSSSRKHEGKHCIKVWYFMRSIVSELSILQLDNENITELWKDNLDHGNLWRLASGTLDGNLYPDGYWIDILGLTGSNDSVLAIDDAEVIEGSCPPAGHCNFERDLCGWINNQENTFNWLRYTSSEPSSDGIFGPPLDHTYGSTEGHSLVANMNGQEAGSQAELFSDAFESTNQCISFWYHAHLAPNLTIRGAVIEKDVTLEFLNLNVTLEELESWTQLYRKIKFDPEQSPLHEAFVSLTLVLNQTPDSKSNSTFAIDDITLGKSCDEFMPTTTTTTTTTSTTPWPNLADCDFEEENDPFCQWRPLQEIDPNAEFIAWKKMNRSTPNIGTGPPADHTLNSGEGHYAAVLSYSDTEALDVHATLISPDLIPDQDQGLCFQMWYFMYGTEVKTLEVRAKDLTEVVWEASYSQGPSWKKMILHFDDVKPFTIGIRAFTGNGDQGDIAIDDIIAYAGQCQESLEFCDFEQDMCEFHVGPESESLHWRRVRADDADHESPLKDHTLNTGYGHFATTEVKQANTSVSGTLTTRSYPSGTICVDFWYFFSGASQKLEILKRASLDSDPVEPPLLIMEYLQAHFWMKQRVRLEEESDFMLTFRAILNLDQLEGQSMSLDDVAFVTDCEPSSDNGSCDFEFDTCGWSPYVWDELHWIQAFGQVHPEFGPHVDHTQSNEFGRYLYVASDPNSGYGAAIASPVFPNADKCFTVWTWQENEVTVRLDIISGLTRSGLPVGPISPTQNGIWAQVALQYDMVFPESKTVFFEIHANFRGVLAMVAIDDIVIEDGLCSDVGFTTTMNPCILECDGHCIGEGQVCDFTSDCVNGQDEANCSNDCDFEAENGDGDPCGYEGDPNGLWRWTLIHAGDEPNFGPPSDHSFRDQDNTGHYYCIVQGDDQNIDNEEASLTSATFQQAYYTCKIKFWYHMANSTDSAREYRGPESRLKLNVVHKDFESPIFHVKGDQGYQWHGVLLQVGHVEQPFKIRFQGSIADGEHLALDDVELVDCGLPPIAEDCLLENQFQCQRGSCISQDFLCNFEDDCGDWSDEDEALAHCQDYVGRCSFEDGSICDWITPSDGVDGEEEDNNSLSWTITSGLDTEMGPFQDHSTNSPKGNFLYIDTTKSKQSVIESPPIYWNKSYVTPNGGENLPCLFRMYYYFYGSDLASLEVIATTYENGPYQTLWMHDESVGLFWEYKEILLREIDGLKLRVVAKTQLDAKIGIALDDLSFSSNCRPLEKPLPPFVTEAPPTPAPCEPNQYECSDQACIMMDSVCNFAYDCSDGGDEHFCAQCDFEPPPDGWGLCGWSDISTGFLRWELRNLEPIFRQGHGMQVEENVGGVSDKAVLRSPKLGAVQSQCLMSFEYVKNGGGDGRVQLTLDLITSDGERVHIWNEQNDPGSEVQLQEIVIGQRDPGWRLEFIGLFIYDQAIVVVDNVQFTNCTQPPPEECQNGQFTCQNGGCVAQTELCDFSNDCGDGSDEAPILQECRKYVDRCSFEKDWCQYETDSESDVEIRLVSPSTTTEGEGPGEDHTLGLPEGHFLFAKGSNNVTAKARIHGQTMRPAVRSDSCVFRYWYRFDDDRSKIQLFTRDVNSGEEQPLGVQHGSEEFGWIRGKTDYLTWTHNWELVIEVVKGVGIGSEVGLDDFSFTPGCEPFHSGSACFDNEFDCGNFICIPKEQVCDFVPQCPNGVDEALCPTKCAFENNTCFWEEDSNVEMDFHWVIASANNPENGTDIHGPIQEQEGNFLFLLYRSESGLDLGTVSPKITSQGYRNAASTCQWHFWAFINGDTGSFIEAVLLDLEMKTTVPLMVFGQNDQVKSDTWAHVSIGLGRRQHKFELVLQRESNIHYDAGVAFDEFVLDRCAIPQKPSGTCDSTSFICATTEYCLSIDHVCDFVDDCGDGSDEKDCFDSPLQQNFEFSFEESIFANDPDNDFQWDILQPQVLPKGTMPSFDHTTGTQNGHYLAPKDVQQLEAKSKGSIHSVPLEANQKCTVRFYAHMLGSDIGQLTIYHRYEDGTLFEYVPDLNGEDNVNEWTFQVVKFDVQSPFQFVLQYMMLQEGKSNIAIDDISFTNDCKIYNGPWNGGGSCDGDQFTCTHSRQCIPKYDVCNFRPDCGPTDLSDEAGCPLDFCTFDDETTCGWRVHSDGSEIGWELATGAEETDSSAPKPDVDVTEGSEEGVYVWAKPSDEVSGGLQSHLYTSQFGELAPQCKLVFFYWMNGTDLGTLSVTIQNNLNQVLIWMESGNHGPLWREQIIFIGHKAFFSLSINVERGDAYGGSMAIDGISFADCRPEDPLPPGQECPRPETDFRCQNLEQCLAEELVCDFAEDCMDGSDERYDTCVGYKNRCDFEVDLCDWTNDKDDDLDWTLVKASGNPIRAGPDVDHTSMMAGGQYLFADINSPDESGGKARLSSKVFQSGRRKCMLRFFYFFPDGNDHELIIYKRFSYDENGLKEIMQIKEASSSFWNSGQVSLDDETVDENQDFQLVIEANFLTNTTVTSLALDDLSFNLECTLSHNQELPGGSSTTPKPTDCGEEGRLSCGNGQCYTEEQECNFQQDCDNNEDEKSCSYSCDFENSWCHWFESDGSATWESSTDNGDHTVGGVTHLAIQNGDPQAPAGRSAILRSTLFHDSGSKCALTFWFRTKQDGQKYPPAVKAIMKTVYGSHELFVHQHTNEEATWIQGRGEIGQAKELELMIQGSLGGGLSYVNIDDVALESCDADQEIIFCSDLEFQCLSQDQCIPRQYRCDEKFDCLDKSDESKCPNVAGDCAFDNDRWTPETCHWTQLSNDEFDWRWASQVDNGPDNGHYILDGRRSLDNFFIFAPAKNITEGYTAAIATPSFPSSNMVCFVRFWYFMHYEELLGEPDGMGRLNVYLEEMESGRMLKLFAAIGLKPKGWQYESIELGSTMEFRVVFEAIKGMNDKAIIALDDVTFTPECETGGSPTTPSPCQPEEYQCSSDNECIPLVFVCDCNPDCSMGEDEKNCDPDPNCPTTMETTQPSSSSSTQETSTTVTTPEGPLCDQEHFDCGGSTCIPSFYLCDGVSDCSNGIDEDRTFCPTQPCEPDYYFCQNANLQHPCLGINFQCNDQIDCDNGSDESVCGYCPKDYCLNEGHCSLSTRGVPVCECEDSWEGNRCQLGDEDNDVNRMSLDVIIPVVAIILVLGGGVAGYVVYRRQKTKTSSDTSERGFVNPFLRGPILEDEIGILEEFQMDELGGAGASFSDRSSKARKIGDKDSKKEDSHDAPPVLDGPMSVENPMFFGQ